MMSHCLTVSLLTVGTSSGNERIEMNLAVKGSLPLTALKCATLFGLSVSLLGSFVVVVVVGFVVFSAAVAESDHLSL